MPHWSSYFMLKSIICRWTRQRLSLLQDEMLDYVSATVLKIFEMNNTFLKKPDIAEYLTLLFVDMFNVREGIEKWATL